MTDLADLTEGLKRQLAVPGEFLTSYPSTTDQDLAATLADGFSMAQLDGFFGHQALDVDTGSVSPDLSAAGRALVGLYAAEIVLLSKLRAISTRVVYESAGSRYEKEQSAAVLAAELKLLQERKKRLLEQSLRLARASSGVYMVDAYLTRSLAGYGGSIGELGGYFGYELVARG